YAIVHLLLSSSRLLFFLYLLTARPAICSLFPYPPLFRSSSRAIGGMDTNGKVLPGYTIVTFDTVIRPSHKEAYQVPNSELVNTRSEEHTSELQSRFDLVCRLLLEKQNQL